MTGTSLSMGRNDSAYGDIPFVRPFDVKGGATVAANDCNCFVSIRIAACTTKRTVYACNVVLFLKAIKSIEQELLCPRIVTSDATWRNVQTSPDLFQGKPMIDAQIQNGPFREITPVFSIPSLLKLPAYLIAHDTTKDTATLEWRVAKLPARQLCDYNVSLRQ